MTHLLDTDRFVDYLNDRGDSRAVLAPLVRRGVVATSVIVLAEIYEGLIRDPKADAKTAVIDEVLAGSHVYGIDDVTARRFASLRHALRTSGQLINDHDIWIAATALEHDLTLISRDRHFDRIPNLKLLR